MGSLEILPEEDAVALSPFEVEREIVFEDAGGVGEEAAVPEVGAAAVEDVEARLAGGGRSRVCWCSRIRRG